MNSIAKFAAGSAMGFMLGAGLMMMPVSDPVRRDVKHKAVCMKRMLKNL